MLCQVITTFWRWWEIHFYHQKIRTSWKGYFIFKTQGRRSLLCGTQRKLVWKKEGGEIIECSDTLEQSKAKPNRSKELWIPTMQDWQKHRGADPECWSPSCQKTCPYFMQPVLCPCARPAWGYFFLILKGCVCVFVGWLVVGFFESWKNGWESKTPVLSLLDQAVLDCNNPKGDGIVHSAQRQGQMLLLHSG